MPRSLSRVLLLQPPLLWSKDEPGLWGKLKQKGACINGNDQRTLLLRGR